ncbi:hypothetical protein [Streptomyces sp. DT171]|uniref:hypothetical protein n=1 Tax=Streptomyces sp. DT171 TaxID=3416524 RepID=UPI003CF61FF7
MSVIRTGFRGAAVAAVLAAALVSCTSATTTNGPGGDVPDIPPASAAAKEAAAKATTDPENGTGPADRSSDQDSPDQNSASTVEPGPEAVRDAFAGLQATLGETCTPGAGDCDYFLGRVNGELRGLDEAMRADSKGPAHFKEPLAWMGAMRKSLGNDWSVDNLEKHRSELIGTRDRINTWMQGHPDDYR